MTVKRKNSGLLGGCDRISKRRRGEGWLVAVMVAVVSAAVSARAAQSAEDSARQIQALIQAGNLGAAREELARAIRANSKNASLYNLQGVVLVQQGDTAGAEKSFKTAIELAPNYLAAYENLARIYESTVNRDASARIKALDVYERILRIDPGNPEANYRGGVLLFQKASYRSSLEHLSKLPKQEQERAPALSMICGDLAGQGEVERAAMVGDRLARSADLAETDVLSLLPVLSKAENRALEFKLLEALEARGLGGAETLRALGLAYEQSGKLDSARIHVGEGCRTPAQLRSHSHESRRSR